MEGALSESIVERYNLSLRRFYKKMNKDSFDIQSALYLFINSIKPSVGPVELVLTLSVFEALPRLELPIEPPTPSTPRGPIFTWKATDIALPYLAEGKVRNAMRPLYFTNDSDVHKATIGSPVLVYGPERSMRWQSLCLSLIYARKMCFCFHHNYMLQKRLAHCSSSIYRQLFIHRSHLYRNSQPDRCTRHQSRKRGNRK